MKQIAALVLMLSIGAVPAASADVLVTLTGPFVTLDLGLPFTLSVILSNAQGPPAQNVEVALELPVALAIQSLPAGCTSLTATRIVCRAAEVPQQISAVVFPITLVAPATWQDPQTFTATVGTSKSFRTVSFFPTIYVTTTADEGTGSLRAAIEEANVICRHPTPCKIAFRIDEPSANRWKTIRLTSPLPAVLAPALYIDGEMQTRFFGDTNPDGPEIEITGGGTLDGDGLTVTSCNPDVGHLALNGFRGNGVSVVAVPFPGTNCLPGYSARLHDLFIGTDPTGAEARPNLRGVGTLTPNGITPVTALPGTRISGSVISGNLRSGVFAYFGMVKATNNRIGVKAHSDEPLPNGNAGIYIGQLGYGSHVGENVIAFNGHMGVAVAGGINDVSVIRNRIWGNGGLGVDIGLDGPTPIIGVPAPTLTLARYDPATNRTIIEGDYTGPLEAVRIYGLIDIFANDQIDSSGYGEGQRLLGTLTVTTQTPRHFVFAVDGDLTGQFITATATRAHYIGFAKPADVLNATLTQTSEFSRAVEVR